MLIETLKELSKDTVELNKKLKNILVEIDNQNLNLAGMRDVSIRIRKSFELYKSLVNELNSKDQFK